MSALEDQRQGLLGDSTLISEKYADNHDGADWSLQAHVHRKLSPLLARLHPLELKTSLSSSWHNYAGPCVAFLCGVLLCFVFLQGALPPHDPTSLVTTSSSVTPALPVYVKPEGVKIIGFIFYGRPMMINVLDCYLRKNLAVNGGYLDEVHFVANTPVQEDLDYLDALVEEVPEYVRVNRTGLWKKLWDYTAQFDPETIFVKIDDDIVSV